MESGTGATASYQKGTYSRIQATPMTDAHDRKSQGGYVGGFRNQAVTTAVSGKTHRVATSTYQAEAAWASKAAKQAEYTRNVHQFLNILRPEP